jgi:diacylglycerol kinase (ATP)
VTTEGNSLTCVARRLPDQAEHVLVAYNPMAGARSASSEVEELVRVLLAKGFQAEAITDLGRLSDRVSELLDAGTLRALVGAGGDGTAAELINRTPAGVPFVLMPGGTENLLSKYLEQSRGVQPVVEIIERGLVVQLDAGHATGGMFGAGRYFLLMASCGIDADVVQRVHANRDGHIRHFSYFKPIWHSIRNYEYPEIRVYFRNARSKDAPDQWQLVRARWAFVTNLPRYARGLKFSPGAVGTDGLFDLCTFRKGSLMNGLMYLGGVAVGQHEKFAGCEIVKATHIRLESDEEDVPIQLDGDPGGHLPMEMSVVPGRLSLLVSDAWAAGQGIEID